MFPWQRSSVAAGLVIVVGLMVLGGCTTQRTVDKGAEAMRQKNWDAAVYFYLEALARDPGNTQYQMALTFARQKAANQHFERGQKLRELGRLAAARDEIQMAVQLDPTQQYAQQILDQLDKEMEVLSQPGGAETLAQMKKEAREAKVKPPVLNPTSKEPITLNFPKPKPVKEIYQAMAKAYGFNVIFDPKLRDDKISIELNDVTAERALELVMQNAGHFYKVLDPHTIIIAEDNPQNRRDYEDLVIKTFFLSNADVKDVDKLLRSLIEARRLSTNEQLNAITLRDTADKVAIAERLIDVNDKAKGEVLVDVELLLLTNTKDSNLGAALSTYSYNLDLDTAKINPDAPDGALFLDDLDKISRSDWFINIPSVLINLSKASGEAEVLAQPQLRITEGEKASLVIGDRVPIPVTSFNTANTIGGSVVPITSFQYQDVGIKIEVEPRVHHNREVTLKLSVEVSNLGAPVSVGPDQQAVTIGTRNITSVIRLRSGESSLLAGLMREDKSTNDIKTPLLSSIPGLGRLFTSRQKSIKNTDLVLTLTPHIIRFPEITEEDLAPLWVGTESNITFAGSRSPRVQSGRSSVGPFDATPPSARRAPSGARHDSTDTRPYGIPPRRVTPGPDTSGQELVPGAGNNKALDSSASAQVRDDETLDTPALESAPPLMVTLEPSVVSLAPDEETVLQVVVRDAPSAYQLPLGLSYDPARLTVESVQAAPGVTVTHDAIDDQEGWVELGLDVPQGRQTAHAVAAFKVRALAAGPVPLVFTSSRATLDDGTQLPVATSDGALFVAQPPVAREQ